MDRKHISMVREHVTAYTNGYMTHNGIYRWLYST
jgi:hypothetical protein